MPNSGGSYYWNDTSAWSKITPSSGVTLNQNSNTTQPITSNSSSLSNNTTGISSTSSSSTGISSTSLSNSQYSPSTQKNGWSSTSTSTPSNPINNYTNSNTNSLNSIPAESRKDLITRLYKRILGREPDKYGLNYYLYHTQYSELDIAKDMYESKEHNEILDKAKDVRNMVIRLDFTLKELREKKMNIAKLETLNKSYKDLLSEKQSAINQVSHFSNSSDESPTYSQENQSVEENSSEVQKSSTTITTQLPDPFEDLDSQNKGFFAKLFG